MAKVEVYFYKQNKLIKKRTYYDLYSLFTYGLSKTEHLIKFKETANYDQAIAMLYPNIKSNKVVDQLSVKIN
jgi:hypothetical protein